MFNLPFLVDHDLEYGTSQFYNMLKMALTFKHFQTICILTLESVAIGVSTLAAPRKSFTFFFSIVLVLELLNDTFRSQNCPL